MAKYIETLMNKNNISLEQYERTPNHVMNKTESLKIKRKLHENYLEFYKEKLASSEKLTFYKHIDRDYSLAPYLLNIKNHNFRQALTKLRISAHKLEIESGRYNKTQREKRICKVCSIAVEDELHFSTSCPKINNRRNTRGNTFGQNIQNFIPEWETLNGITKLYIKINPPAKIALTSAQFCHDLLINRYKYQNQNQNQNSLLVKRQNDNTSPGDWPRKISP